MPSHGIAALACAALAMSGCNAARPAEDNQSLAARADAGPPGARSTGATSPPAESVSSIVERLDAIDAAIATWRSAPDIAIARRAAEAARNLVVGPAGPGYGDADGDGRIGGASAFGLLPGLKGERGLAGANANACTMRDVLGGSWADPARRWAILNTAIADWTPTNNTFPALPSHPQRIVSWAGLTLATANPVTAREYAGHAAIHARVSRRALTACRG